MIIVRTPEEFRNLESRVIEENDDDPNIYIESDMDIDEFLEQAGVETIDLFAEMNKMAEEALNKRKKTQHEESKNS